MNQGPSGAAEKGIMKGPWTEEWEGYGSNTGYPVGPALGRGDGGGAPEQGCSVEGPSPCSVERSP